MGDIVDMENPIDDIVGLYSDVPSGSWRPNTIMVNMGREDIDGTYEYLAAGGGGVVFLNEKENTILKVNYYAFDDKEVLYQKKVGTIAAEIFYDLIREVGSDTPAEAFGGDKVQIVIMEYLDPVNWIPLRGKELITDYQENLFELIYTLIYEHKIQNVIDFVGNTGPHIFMKVTGEMKVVDYGQFKESTNPPYDFIMMVKELQDVVIPWSKDGQEECYRKIMDLSEEVTDKECTDLLLYKGREFWKKKQLQKTLRRSQRISSKSKYGLGISGTINKPNKTKTKTSRGGTSKRKNNFRKSKRKSKRRKNKGLRKSKRGNKSKSERSNKSNGKGKSNGKRGNKSKRKYRK